MITTTQIIWKHKAFSELTLHELYCLIRLRLEVFVVEQNANYQDADLKDLNSYHVLGLDNDENIVAYARVIPAGVAYNEASIGRVVSSLKVRRKGVGHQLIKQALACVQNNFGMIPIKISAQSYLIPFYEQYGFKVISDEYLEDGLPHKSMIKLI